MLQAQGSLETHRLEKNKQIEGKARQNLPEVIRTCWKFCQVSLSKINSHQRVLSKGMILLQLNFVKRPSWLQFLNDFSKDFHDKQRWVKRIRVRARNLAIIFKVKQLY